MVRIGWMVTAMVAALVGGCGGRMLEAQPAARTVEARIFRVVDVVDGDTVRIIYDESPTRVRLAVIDAPERGRPGAAEATAALRELVGGRLIRIEFTERSKRDNWGRLLATVWVVGPDGEEIDAGAELLRRGLVGRWRPKK